MGNILRKQSKAKMKASKQAYLQSYVASTKHGPCLLPTLLSFINTCQNENEMVLNMGNILRKQSKAKMKARKQAHFQPCLASTKSCLPLFSTFSLSFWQVFLNGSKVGTKQRAIFCQNSIYEHGQNSVQNCKYQVVCRNLQKRQPFFKKFLFICD